MGTWLQGLSGIPASLWVSRPLLDSPRGIKLGPNGPMWIHMGPYGVHMGPYVFVFFLFDNLGNISLRSPISGTPLGVPAVEAAVARGLMAHTTIDWTCESIVDWP